MSSEEKKTSDNQASDNFLPVKKENDMEKKGLVKRTVTSFFDWREKRLEELDPIYTEPITPVAVEDEAKEPLCRGGVDKWFLLFATMLLCFGIVMCYSAGVVEAQVQYDNPTHYLVRNIGFSAVAIFITSIFVMFFRPWHLRYLAVITYAGAIFFLLLVLVIGTVGGGAQRWIAIGPITIQPSEVGKTGVVMMLALYMSKYEKEISSVHKYGGSFKHGFFMPLMIIGLVCGLVALEKHISGLMIIGIIGVCVMFLGGTRAKWLLAFFAFIAVAFAGLLFVSSYAQERVYTWMHIYEVDPLGPAWQTLQGLYAIGSGGFFGTGIGSSRQKYGYVPEPQNDFVFPIICEELGFIGAFLLVALFVLLVWRGIKIGQNAPDKFTALTVWGLTFKIALQAAMNIAVVTNSMPNTGVSLPFVSSGGTALMIQIFEVGIILLISRFSKQKNKQLQTIRRQLCEY